MARHLLATVFLAAGAASLSAQAPSTTPAANPVAPATAVSATPAANQKPFKLGPKIQKEATQGGPEVENVLKALEALTPEQRAKFKDNFIRWINLSVDEKRNLREREETRKRRIAEEIQDAITASGLTLEGPSRTKFAKRYAEERRKIEERIRGEMDTQRKAAVQETIARLKVEFSGTAPVVATPTPSP